MSSPSSTVTPPEQLEISHGGNIYTTKLANAPVGASSSKELMGEHPPAQAAWVSHAHLPRRPRLLSGLFPELPAAVATSNMPFCSYAAQSPAWSAQRRTCPHVAANGPSGLRVTAEGHATVRDPRQCFRFS